MVPIDRCPDKQDGQALSEAAAGARGMYVGRAGGVRGRKTGGPRKENGRSPYNLYMNTCQEINISIISAETSLYPLLDPAEPIPKILPKTPLNYRNPTGNRPPTHYRLRSHCLHPPIPLSGHKTGRPQTCCMEPDGSGTVGLSVPLRATAENLSFRR